MPNPRASITPYVGRIEVGPDNFLWMNTSENFHPDVHRCRDLWLARSAWPITDARTKAMLKLATESFMGGKEVYIQTNGCIQVGLFQHPVITNLVLNRLLH
jgi:hypothetical protein